MSKQNGVMKEESQPPVIVEQVQPRVVKLTPLQQDYLQQYAISLNQASAKVATARTALRLAEEAEAVAQNAANAFLRFCAEDLEVDLRLWQFDQPNLRFVPLVVPPAGVISEDKQNATPAGVASEQGEGHVRSIPERTE